MAHQATWGDTGQPLEKLDEVPLDDNWIKRELRAGPGVVA